MSTPLSESGNKKPKFGKKNKTKKNSFCCIWRLCQVYVSLKQEKITFKQAFFKNVQMISCLRFAEQTRKFWCSKNNPYRPQFPHFIAEETRSSVVLAPRATVVIAICLV